MDNDGNCCRLCFLSKSEHLNLFENAFCGLNIAETIEKYFPLDVS